MQFNTGNPNLVGLTTYLAGQDSQSQGSLYTLQEVKDHINLAYEELWSRAKVINVGWGVSSAQLNTVANALTVDISSLNIDGKILTVELEPNGLAVTDSAAETIFLAPVNRDVGLQMQYEGVLTQPKKYSRAKNNTLDSLAIHAPPAVGGTNSLRVTFEVELTYLSADADVPLIPKSHHQLIAYVAAISLRAGKDFNTQEIRAEAARKFPEFMEIMNESVQDPDIQIPTAGRIDHPFFTKTGFIIRQ